jgi:hypothetical protein
MLFTVATAANESSYANGHRERTVPIPSTITPITGYPSKLVIFKMAASKFWQVRCWVAGRTHRKSTQSQSTQVARHFARQFYEQLLADHRIANLDAQVKSNKVGLTATSKSHPNLTCDSSAKTNGWTPDTPLRTPQFAIYADHLLRDEQARVDRREYTLGSLQVLRNRLEGVILPAMGDYPVTDINYARLQNFTHSLSERFSSITVSQYLIAVRKVLSAAVSLGALQSLPEFPKVKAQTNSRGPFTPTEYWQLLRTSRALCGKRPPDDANTLRVRHGLRQSDHTMPPDVAWVIGFMVNSFIRPSDLKTLKHKHVEIVRNAHVYLRLTLPATKSHDKPIVTLQPAVRVYRALTQYHRLQDNANPNDYLFLPQHKDRAYAARVLAFYFNWVMAETGLKHGAQGQPRSLYSLRHSSITFRLLYGHGIDVLTLARNARTSVDMINRHYASTLTAEQNIGILQSRRPQARLSE